MHSCVIKKVNLNKNKFEAKERLKLFFKKKRYKMGKMGITCKNHLLSFCKNNGLKQNLFIKFKFILYLRILIKEKNF